MNILVGIRAEYVQEARLNETAAAIANETVAAETAKLSSVIEQDGGDETIQTAKQSVNETSVETRDLEVREEELHSVEQNGGDEPVEVSEQSVNETSLDINETQAEPQQDL